jgi:D-alanyl-lipoteichoic acid acyltransferase DltB (MBOAT superfamily)
MLFNSLPYAIFLLAVFGVFWAVSGKQRTTHLLLLAGSYFFYGCWNIEHEERGAFSAGSRS